MPAPLTVSVVNPKGGTGKTTIAVHLAVASHRSGYPTKLLDTDPQGTALDWRRQTPEGYDGPPVEPTVGRDHFERALAETSPSTDDGRAEVESAEE